MRRRCAPSFAGSESELPPGSLDRLFDRACVRLRSSCGTEPVTGEGLDPGALIGQPLIERVLSNAEPFEKLAADEFAFLGGARLFQPGHVQVDGRAIEVERVAVRGDDRMAQRLAQGCQRLAEIVAGLRVDHPAPQQSGQVIARMPAPRWKGEIGQQGFGFLPADFEAASRALRAEPA